MAASITCTTANKFDGLEMGGQEGEPMDGDAAGDESPGADGDDADADTDTDTDTDTDSDTNTEPSDTGSLFDSGEPTEPDTGASTDTGSTPATPAR